MVEKEEAGAGRELTYYMLARGPYGGRILQASGIVSPLSPFLWLSHSSNRNDEFVQVSVYHLQSSRSSEYRIRCCVYVWDSDREGAKEKVDFWMTPNIWETDTAGIGNTRKMLKEANLKKKGWLDEQAEKTDAQRYWERYY